MSSVGINKKLSLQLPTYYSTESNIPNDKKDYLIVRIFYAVLPFIVLHKPFGKVITFTMDLIRSVTSFNQLLEKKDSKKLLETIVAISALAGTIFAHPLGLCLSTLYNIGCDLIAAITQLQMRCNQEALNSLLFMTEHFFYLATMIFGSFEIIAMSMLLNMAVELCRSRKELQKGNLLEFSSHLLMSMVRFCQAAPHIEKIACKNDFWGKEYSKLLTETITKIRDRLAISFYSVARFFVNPHWKLTDTWLDTICNYKNDQTSITQKVLSTTKSVFTTLGLLPFALGGLVLGQACHFSAFLLSTNPYIHIKNEANLKTIDKIRSLLQLNCCLTAGGFSKLFGGIVLSNDDRVLKIAEMIKQNDPDLVCLQEVSDIKDAFKLYNELSNKYGDFYFNIGSTPFILQNNSGLFVASKMALENPEVHSFADISGAESMVNKCFFLFSTNNANFITTHLSPSHDDSKPTAQEDLVRSQEQQRILLAAKQRSANNKKPTYVSGDFNINWKSDQYKQGLLFTEGKDYYNKNRSEVFTQDATCETEYLIDRNWHHKKDTKPQQLILDYFLSFFDSNYASVKTHKIATFDTERPEEAISDHSALLSTISS